MQIALSIFQPNKIAYFCDRLHIASIDTLSFHLNPQLFQEKILVYIMTVYLCILLLALCHIHEIQIRFNHMKCLPI